ncbi:hypothetical protein MTR67_027956 [Solanum verrucosum]|uniref:Casein kinase II subunit beta n=1 Tax=Solanum verrucosum TaxID=315347 RepID=A0AAF0RA49_SOLVR|nr:hypothetical protein MTR67_027956 [Solanum verrucosum]
MYKERRVGGGSKPEMGRVGDRKRLNEALDKHLERSSPSTSTTTVRGTNGKDHRFALSKSKDQLRNSAPPPPDNKCSDGYSERESYNHYKLMVMNFDIKRKKKTRTAYDQPRIRWGSLTEAKAQEIREKLVTIGAWGSAESETDSEASDISGSDGEDTSWISWYCGLRGNEFFCEVDDDYIQDDFNLCGLSSLVPYYDYALDLILDVESSHGDMFTEEQNELVESAAEMLYGLIHARYILTTKGLAAMLEKYKNAEFGRCPRVYCCGQPCLPVGQSDIPRQSRVNIYCPRCEDAYTPRSRYHENIDGAYFGTTFPHLFLMTYGHLKPQKISQSYVPRVFGFKVHKP